MPVPKILVIEPENCTGCRICELVCSWYHYKEFNPKRSRITVLRNYELGINIPLTCQQCEVPLCEASCPTGAISRDETTRAMLIDYDKCIGCRLCMVACPFGGTSVDPITLNVIRCDLCDGDPQCAKYCPQEAIRYLPVDMTAILRKKKSTEKIVELSKLILGSGRT